MDRENKETEQDLVNEVLEHVTKIEVFEKLCPDCEGWCIFEASVCRRCNGKGKIDWIEEIKNL